MSDSIVVLDFGSQYTRLILRRLHELRVTAHLVPYHISAEEIRKLNAVGLIFSGSPSSVYAENAPKPHPDVYNMDIPILGICYGTQLIAEHFNGQVEKATSREFGEAEITILQSSQLTNNMPDTISVWMSHGDEITQAPTGFKVTAKSKNCSIAAIEHESGKIFGLQFHPEVHHTLLGSEFLRNFVLDICHATVNWNSAKFIEETLESIRTTVGKSGVVLGLSGGVDSTVVAVLLAKALPGQVTCIFVDNGVMRKNEKQRVVDRIGNRFDMKVIAVDASQRFLDNLKGVTDPEEKRKIIGHTFIEIFEEQAKSIPDVKFLAQGTLYPDVVESMVDGQGVTIKSHHNVGGLPEKFGLKLIEPLRDLFKDEVREIGLLLGLSEEDIWRHPFPGPGLAVRIPGEVTPEAVKTLQNCDSIVIEELRTAGWYHKVWQAFAVLLPPLSVGVMGDHRTYGRVVALRFVESKDGMTADWAELPGALIRKICRRIVNEVEGVNRVVLDVTSKPPATIEWE